jgi:hypothetical protein
VPGNGFRDQVRAVQDVLGNEAAYEGDVTGAWDALMRPVREWPGTAVISMEFLGGCQPFKAKHVVEQLGDARVEVVLTVRDLNRNIPAMWQETLQNGRHWTWQQWLRGVRRARPDAGEDEEPIRPGLAAKAGRLFWRQQDVGRIGTTWADAVGADRFTVVTLPHPGAPRELLRQRFGQAVGFDADVLAAAPSSNPSLGAASAQLLRRLNAVLAEHDLAIPHGGLLRKHVIAKRLLASHRSEEPAIGLPVPDWVPGTAASMVAELQKLGVGLIGDWAELEPVEVPGIDPMTVTAEDEREATFVGLAGLLEHLIREQEGLPARDSTHAHRA